MRISHRKPDGRKKEKPSCARVSLIRLGDHVDRTCGGQLSAKLHGRTVRQLRKTVRRPAKTSSGNTRGLFVRLKSVFFDLFFYSTANYELYFSRSNNYIYLKLTKKPHIRMGVGLSANSICSFVWWIVIISYRRRPRIQSKQICYLKTTKSFGFWFYFRI